MAAEVLRQKEATTTQCKFTEHGCRYRPFLNRSRVSAHEARCCFNPLHKTAAKKATVRVQVQVGGAVRLSLTGSGRVGQHGGGAVHASLSLIANVPGSTGARVVLSTRRPKLGPAYGLQPHSAVHALSTTEAKRDAEATESQAVVSVTLLRVVEASGSTRVSLVLRPRCLEMRARGWAIFEAFRSFARVESGGYASVESVYELQVQLRDSMETFWLSETLKYLWLLFSEDDVLPLDEWVLNTQAHPLPIRRKAE